MAAALELQVEYTSLLSAPTPLSPCGAGVKTPFGPAVAAWPRPCFAPRRSREGAGRPSSTPPSSSPGARAPAAAGQKPCEGTTESYEEGIVTEGSRAVFT